MAQQRGLGPHSCCEVLGTPRSQHPLRGGYPSSGSQRGTAESIGAWSGRGSSGSQPSLWGGNWKSGLGRNSSPAKVKEMQWERIHWSVSARLRPPPAFSM
eukprot:2531259-Pyramimonas_sp.AAC.1